MCVQYIRGYSVHQGVFSTSGGYHEYIGRCSVHQGDIMMHVGDIMMHVGDIMMHMGDIMMHVGEQVGKNLSISIENPDVLNIPQCTEIPRCPEHPPMYTWYPANVLNTPRCTHDIPLMYSWYPPDVRMISPDVLMVSPMY